MPGKLYLIPSLLSEENNSVIPLQTKETLHSLDIFIVENEKKARHFLKAMSYPKPLQQVEMKVLDEHTKQEQVPQLLLPLLSGENVGLISEAGCPAVADPGSDLVRLAHEKNIQIIPLTGPSSILLALMGSGLNGQGFSFLGYLPRERNERIKALKELERSINTKNQTQIFIEAPYRNQHLLEDILAHVNKNLSLCIACNLTGKDEFIKTQSVEEWKRNVPILIKSRWCF